MQIDGTLFAQPIYVGDPGAKMPGPTTRSSSRWSAFPRRFTTAKGVITEVLGPRGTPGVDTLSIIREFNLPDQLCRRRAGRGPAAGREVRRGDRPDRTDFTGETIVTIDPVDARDFDDAISLEQLDNGHWRLGVHIADVSHFVRPRTALDREALERATSVYLPDRVLPMLPEIDLQRPGEPSAGQGALHEIGRHGVYAPRGCALPPSFIRRPSAAASGSPTSRSMSFWPTARRGGASWGPRSATCSGHMHTLAMTLRNRRLKNGALELNMPEVKVDLDKQGSVTGAHVVENTESHQIIEEFMLAANEAVAELLHDHGLHFLRRIHQAPSPAKIKCSTSS